MVQFNSRTAKAAVLALGKILASFATLLTAALLTRVFDKVEYATYQQTFLAFDFVSPMLTLGIPSAVYFFIPQRRDAARAVFVENSAILCCGGLLFSLGILFGGGDWLAQRFGNTALTTTLTFVIPYAFFELLTRSVGPSLMAQDRPVAVATYAMLSPLIIFVGVLPCALLVGSTYSVIWAIVAASAVRAGMGIWLVWRATSGTRWVPNRNGMIEQLKYGIPLGIAALFGTLTLSIDRVIVASICPLDEFAVYSVGAFEVPLVAAITGSINAVLLTDLSSMFFGKKYDAAVQLWKRAGLKCSMLLFPATVMLFITAPNVVTLLFSEEYRGSILPFRCYLILMPIRVVNYGSMLMSAGQGHVILLRAVVSCVLNAVFSILLTLWIGYVGAIISTLIIVYVWEVPFNLRSIKNTWQSSYANILPWRGFLSVLSISLICSPPLFLGVSLFGGSEMLTLAVVTTCYCALVLIAYVYVGLVAPQSISNIFGRFFHGS